MSKQQSNLIRHLAEQLQHFAWQAAGDKVPKVEQFAEFMAKHFSDQGIALTKDAVTEDANVAALFKKKESDQINRRMRELSGIPHKGNFV